MKRNFYLAGILIFALICLAPQKSQALENRHLLVIMANFNNRSMPTQTRSATYNQTFVGSNSVANFFKENSYGQVEVSGEVFPSAAYNSEFYTMNLAHTCDLMAIASAAMESLETAEGDEAVDFLTVDHLVVSVPVDSSCGQGLGYVGEYDINTPDGRHKMTVSWVVSFQAVRSPYAMAHEIGHGLGVQHAGILDCGTVPFKSTGCTVRAAHDMSSIMGIGVTHPGHFSAPHKEAIGFFDSTRSIQTVSQQNINSTGVYELTPLESSEAGVKAIKIPRSASGKFWYIEFRQQIGFDGLLSRPADSFLGLAIHTNASHSAYTDSILIDPSPEAIDWISALLKTDTVDPHTGQVGFYDPVDKIHIAVTAINTNEINPVLSRASVKITFDNTVVNQPTETPVNQPINQPSNPPAQAYCGDGLINQSSEQCDQGTSGSATCSATCQTLTANNTNVVIQPENRSGEDSAQVSRVNLPIDLNLSNRLAGRILLQVEAHGEAWYVRTDNVKRMYLANGDSAYALMREIGLGITNSELAKIPIGFESRFQCLDSDSDNLCDKLENSLGTDPNNSDSDHDSYPDGAEVKNGYQPMGTGSYNYDVSLANRLKGKILLQVQAHGEAWYVNPVDGKRYYMPDGSSAYEIMRYLSLGISNDDLNKIGEY